MNILGTPQPRKSRIIPDLAEQLNEYYSKLPDELVKKQTKKQTYQTKDISEIKGMIYVPSVKLYFSKQRTHLNENWFECHKSLLLQGKKMPTIPEFIEFLKHLRNNPSDENTPIYNEITEVREPWRAEWLDADFKVKNDKLHINYNHVLDSNGNLVPKNTEKLESCLMKDCYADILAPNKQGLPNKKTSNQEFYFWYPKSNNKSVARFYADSDRAYLSCYWNPGGRGALLGVREARTK